MGRDAPLSRLRSASKAASLTNKPHHEHEVDTPSPNTHFDRNSRIARTGRRATMELMRILTAEGWSTWTTGLDTPTTKRAGRRSSGEIPVPTAWSYTRWNPPACTAVLPALRAAPNARTSRSSSPRTRPKKPAFAHANVAAHRMTCPDSHRRPVRCRIRLGARPVRCGADSICALRFGKDQDMLAELRGEFPRATLLLNPQELDAFAT